MLRRPIFWFSMCLTLVCFVFEHRDYLGVLLTSRVLYRLDVYYLFTEPFQYGLFFYLLPLIAMPPAALMILEDMNSRNIRMRMHRSTRLRYMVSKVMVSSICSVLPLLMAFGLFLLFALCIGPIDNPDSLAQRALTHAQDMQKLTIPCHGFGYIAFLTLMSLVAAWIWGLAGVIFALITQSQAHTLVLGCLSFWGIDVLCNRLQWPHWRPFNLFYISPHYTGSLSAPLLRNMLLLVVAHALVCALMTYRHRRL